MDFTCFLLLICIDFPLLHEAKYIEVTPSVVYRCICLVYIVILYVFSIIFHLFILRLVLFSSYSYVPRIQYALCIYLCRHLFCLVLFYVSRHAQHQANKGSERFYSFIRSVFPSRFLPMNMHPPPPSASSCLSLGAARKLLHSSFGRQMAVPSRVF